MEELEAEPAIVGWLAGAQRKFQYYVDKTTVWSKSRWCALLVLMSLYVLRVYLVKGFYIVTYGLGIYMLNLLIGFLSPAIDPETEEEGALPTSESTEFRPFTRKLPEFKFWFSAFRAVLIAICMTFFRAFDLPVFWPILLAYFIILVVLTMKDRVRHMMKHKYLPFSMGKQTYGELAKVEVPSKNDK
eukprot:TRINITY_DN108493_c0_g1_i1.p1 TRINITY_DN108493_c0_g1~~TRINITY_DN108493_c0_g1_i1.p1  ORF type:complete len:187 (-),score=38.43 TRINITY_DN108493_c0_g1_i1:70-630(-)